MSKKKQTYDNRFKALRKTMGKAMEMKEKDTPHFVTCIFLLCSEVTILRARLKQAENRLLNYSDNYKHK